jgi:hypothetical protein
VHRVNVRRPDVLSADPGDDNASGTRPLEWRICFEPGLLLYFDRV